LQVAQVVVVVTAVVAVLVDLRRQVGLRLLHQQV
jgi:hypothetical protein